MSFRSLKNIQLPQDGNNATASLTQLPTTVLEALIPGYALITRVASDIFGFDISALISVIAITVGLFTAASFAWRHVSAQFLRFYSASITIDMDDPIYEHMLAWASVQRSLMTVRSLRGHSAGEALDEDDTEIKVDDDFADDAIFNFNDWAAKAPPKYEPHASSGMFRHTTSSGKRYWFKLDRDRERVPSGWMGTIQDKEKLVLTVLGRSTIPLKELIDEARDRYLSQKTTLTTIQRPRPKEHRGRGRQAWQRVSARPSRPMATVVLDDVQKATILKDINDFLHPRTPRWYSNRGIPYRRGYLFHGPPGTGKTSLSFALAGVFGLDIYCLSLSEATLTEEDLILLFNSLPKRCVVLLEDIDSAGVLRKKEDENPAEKDDSKPSVRRGGRGKGGKIDAADTEGTTEDAAPVPTAAESAAAKALASEVAKAITSATEKSNASKNNQNGNVNRAGITNANQGISLSGLLNAIDGVASQEGRVLVMTTNFPEKLDDALVRPGRVDLKIEFSLASRQQIRELFVRMYMADDAMISTMPTKISDILPPEVLGAKDIVGTDITAKQWMMNTTTNGHVVSPSSEKIAATAGVPPEAKKLKHNLITPPDTPKKLDGDDDQAHHRQRQQQQRATDAIQSWSPNDDSDETNHGKNDNADENENENENEAEIARLAHKFALLLPESVFSPAEIQGFLLTRKKNPRQAVRDVIEWRDAEIGKKTGKGAGSEKSLSAMMESGVKGLASVGGGKGTNGAGEDSDSD